jgi:SAM-dependent methyltransferase
LDASLWRRNPTTKQGDVNFRGKAMQISTVLTRRERGGVEPAAGQGVRKLTVHDQLPKCTVWINKPAYKLEKLVANKRVLDIGCGYGQMRSPVESAGGRWIGIEAFSGGAHTVAARAENLPFADASFEVVIMNAVLEHVEDVETSFVEVARVLKTGGRFVGYSAFMECFHEISYHHLSFRALEHLSAKNGLNLVFIGGGNRFGIDYHLAVLLHPLPFQFACGVIAALIRGVIGFKSGVAFLVLKLVGRSFSEALRKAHGYYRLECLRQSVGFTFVIEKPGLAPR